MVATESSLVVSESILVPPETTLVAPKQNLVELESVLAEASLAAPESPLVVLPGQKIRKKTIFTIIFSNLAGQAGLVGSRKPFYVAQFRYAPDF